MIYNDDTHILIDCGVAMRTVFEKTGRKEFDALFLSHEHGDHISGAGPLGRKTQVPIYVHETVFKAKETLFDDCVIKNIDETSIIQIGSFVIKPFSTKHDAKHPLGFVIEEPATGIALCYLTDTGNISKTMREATKNCNALFLECDYDDQLIIDFDGYDQMLKDRIMSNFGHLSNKQALEFIQTFNLDQVKAVVFGHISSRTNNPEKVMERVSEYEKLASFKDRIYIAPFEKPLIL
jgi:phosphoribosyl 1,2-cyclic phosphodiesterase